MPFIGFCGASDEILVEILLDKISKLDLSHVDLLKNQGL